MNLQEFTSPLPKPWLNINANSINTESLIIDGVPITPPVVGLYNANITVTNATNVIPSSSTVYMSAPGTGIYTIFGEFKCDVQAFNNVVLNIDLAPGTSCTLSRRTVSLSSNKSGGLLFMNSTDNNVTSTRFAITAYTNNGVVATPANQLATFFFYSITYVAA